MEKSIKTGIQTGLRKLISDHDVIMSYAVVSCPPPWQPVLKNIPAGLPSRNWSSSSHSNPIESRKAWNWAAISKKLKRDPQNYLHNIARRWWPMVVFWVLISVVMVVFFSTRQCFALSVVVSLHCTLVIDVCFFSSSECNEFLFCVSILMNMIAYFLKAKIFCVYKFCCITQAHSNPTHLINNVSLEEGCRDAPFPSALYLSKNRKKKIASPSWKHYHNQKKK